MSARLVSFAVGVALTASALAGCAAAAPEISSTASSAMQTTVVSIAESAAAGDAATALAQLDALQQQLDAAVTDGSVSAERAASIQTRIDLVRGDLQPVVEQTPVVEPAPEAPADTGTETDDSREDDSGEDDSGSGNSGNGNGNGNGNSGKGKDKGND